MSLPPDTPTQPRTPIVLDLTANQLAALEPLFEAVQRANWRGENVAIAAQVYVDGIVVQLLTNEQSTLWRKNTLEAGMKVPRSSSSAAERTRGKP